MPSMQNDDGNDLARLGYKQELSRDLGRFSSFAAGFSYISFLTGVPQLFYLGFAAGGPAFFWTWPLVLAGQFMVALCFAEVASHYPLAGSVYPWSRRLGGPAIGWLAGWIYIWCLVATLAAVVLALQGILPQISPMFQLIGPAGDPMANATNAVLLGCLLIGFTTAINAIGVKLLAKINNAGVFAELIGLVGLIGILAVHAVRGPAVVMDTMGHGATEPTGYFGSFFAASLMAAYVMYGFDTAGSLAEETDNPRKTVPRAILQALGAAGLAGGLLLLVALMAAPDLANAALGRADGGLPGIVNGVLGPTLGALFLADMVFAVTVCALAIHTGTVRLVFAMARDGALPFGSQLAKVSGRSHTPVRPVILVGVLAALVLIVNVRFPQVVSLVSAIAIVWANLAYMFVTVPMLAKRLRGWPQTPAEFALGKWGLPVNAIAVLWGFFIVVNIAWPRPEVYGADGLMPYAAIWLTVLVLAAGAAYYFLVQRHQEGVLAEHRAEESPVATTTA